MPSQVYLLNEAASAEAAVGNSTGASYYSKLGMLISDAVNAVLWVNDTAGGDHYVTQVNTDGSSRDFIDFDSNLIGASVIPYPGVLVLVVLAADTMHVWWNGLCIPGGLRVHQRTTFRHDTRTTCTA